MIAALASGQGKTILTIALLHHYKSHNLQPFKSGPDYIDPQFHQRLCGIPSVNLDRFMMNDAQLRWLFQKYAQNKLAICEGVMGFYDGIERGTSTYDVAQTLNLPVVLVLDGSGSYSTLVAVMEGILHHRQDHTIKAVIFNRLSSQSHFQLLYDLFTNAFPDIQVAGWISNHLETLESRHLGLDLNELANDKLESITREILANIDLRILESAMDFEAFPAESYPFDRSQGLGKKTLCVVRDENFSFLYRDNMELFSEVFQEVVTISAVKDEPIPKSADTLYLPGGYVETADAYGKIRDSKNFRESLRSFPGRVYAECAGLIYLGEQIDDYPMSGVLPLRFTLQQKRKRLGYYEGHDMIRSSVHRGHAFHYSAPVNPPEGAWELGKPGSERKEWGAWQKESVLGTYLHTMFRAEPKLLENYF